MKKRLFTLMSAIALLVMVSCNMGTKHSDKKSGNDSLTTKNEMKLDPAEKGLLNHFFTGFSEINTKPFTKDDVSDKMLIHFGVYYNYRNHFKLFEQTNSGANSRIREDQVADTSMKFFDVKIKKHQSIDGIEYKNKMYTIQNADGEAYRFSQVEKISMTDDGLYLVIIKIYNASSGWTGDINAKPEVWKAVANGEPIPEIEGKMKATIKKITDSNGGHYVLVEYLQL
jgi:hypothetical protein